MLTSAPPDFTRVQLSFQHPIAVFEGLSPTRAADLAPEGRVGPEHCSITLVMSGSAAPAAGTNEVPVASGSVLMGLPESAETPAAGEGIQAVSACIHADWLLGALRALWHEPGVVRLLIAERLFPVCRQILGTMVFEPTEAEFAMLEAEWSHLRGGAEAGGTGLTVQLGALLKILGVLNECLEREDQGTRLPLQPAVWRVADAIETAVAQGLPVRLGELAASVDMPQGRFARMFRDATGIPPRDYIQARRIQHGARMLIEDMDTVTEIALRLGFADAAHFCRVFKRMRGMTPNEFRRHHAVARPAMEAEAAMEAKAAMETKAAPLP